jgi:hypothetical protein
LLKKIPWIRLTGWWTGSTRLAHGFIKPGLSNQRSMTSIKMTKGYPGDLISGIGLAMDGPQRSSRWHASTTAVLRWSSPGVGEGWVKGAKLDGDDTNTCGMRWGAYLDDSRVAGRTGTRRTTLRAWLQTFGGGSSSLQGFSSSRESSFDGGGSWGSSSGRRISVGGGTTVGQ